jgi:hypothetical protein
LWLGLCFQPRTSGNVVPRTTFRTHPHGHRPRFDSSVTSTQRFLPTMTEGGLCSVSVTGSRRDSWWTQLPGRSPLSSSRFIPSLHKVFLVWGEDTSNVSVAVIPVQKTRTHQFAVSRRAEAKCHVRVISIAS